VSEEPPESPGICGVFMLVAVLYTVFSLSCSTSTTSAPPAKTNQQRLDDYHRQGKFTGYTDGNKWAADMQALRNAAR